MTYRTPVRDQLFLLEHAAGFNRLRQFEAYKELSDDLIEAIIGEAGKFSDEVIAPLNRPSDEHGARLEGGRVTTPPGFPEAYRQYVEAGWGSLSFPETYGGQALPQSLALVVTDALLGACLSFSMGTTLTTGATKAILAHGSDAQKSLYLPKLVSGEWTATMNLSEPHAGSDLSNLKCRAEPASEGLYRIKGNKVWISFGDHDMTENICHLVLARLPDAPLGTRGISMFLVPKYRIEEDGTLGALNDVRIGSIEEKLGQHGSPTCVMNFGDQDECYGTLIGKENEGLKNMFVMMNAARIDVGMQGVSTGEKSFQQALSYAQERVQGQKYGDKKGSAIPIIQHPDVRRQLMTMKALTEAGRAICYANMVAYDVAHSADDENVARAAQEREDLLTPLSKAFGSDRSEEVTSLGIQVHGGMGLVEETGVAQHYRDVRVAKIYEGTNGIQALDLIGRKLGMRNGGLAFDFLDEVDQLADDIIKSNHADLILIGNKLAEESTLLRTTTHWMIEAIATDPDNGLSGATPYLDQFGYVAGGFYLARVAKHAAGLPDDAYMQSKVQIARFYAENILPRAGALVPGVMAGKAALAPIEPDLLSC